LAGCLAFILVFGGDGKLNAFSEVDEICVIYSGGLSVGLLLLFEANT
jgi:hypothetical protein